MNGKTEVRMNETERRMESSDESAATETHRENSRMKMRMKKREKRQRNISYVSCSLSRLDEKQGENTIQNSRVVVAVEVEKSSSHP